MDMPLQISLTPELIAAVQAGSGCVRFEDPMTQRIYLLAEQDVVPLDDSYICEKLAEAKLESELGLSVPWDAEGLKAELRAKYASRASE